MRRWKREVRRPAEEKPAEGEKPAEEKPRPAAAAAAAAVIEAIPIGVIVHDLEGKILQANEASEKMFGYKRDEATGKSIIDFVAEEDRPRALESMLKGLREGFTKGFECMGVRKDGSKINVLVDSTLMKDPEGNPSSVVISLRDITELKRAEEELKRSYGELVGLERARDFTFTLFKDIFGPVLKECKPETIARVKELVRKFSENAPIARGAKIADDGSVSFDEASFRKAIASMPPTMSVSEVVSAFSDVMNECYSVVQADLGDEKASAVLSNVFSAAFETPGIASYKLDLLRVVPEGVEIPGAYRVLEAGKSYMVEERTPEHAFAMFVDMVGLGFPGLCISTTHPSDVKAEHELRGRVTVLWISKVEKEFTVSPSNLGILRDRILSFIERNEDSIVLLDGFEYIVTTNGFDVALKFLHDIREDTVVNRARLIVPISPVTLSARELGLLERHMETIEIVEE